MRAAKDAAAGRAGDNAEQRREPHQRQQIAGDERVEPAILREGH